MPELFYFPFNPTEYLSDNAVSAMLPEQEGAYMRLRAFAWQRGTAEPSLPADDIALARLSRLGARWKKLGPFIKQQFVEREGRLYHAQLSAIWMEQQAAYERRAKAGHKGGEAKAKRQHSQPSATSPTVSEPQQTASPVLAMPLAMPQQSESEEAVERTLKGPALPASALDRALGAGAPRAPSANGQAAQHSADAIGEADRMLEQAYFQALRDHVAAWSLEHPDEAAEIEETVRRDQNLPRGRALQGWVGKMFGDAIVLAVRDRNPTWPQSATEWRERKRRKAGAAAADEEPTQPEPEDSEPEGVEAIP